PAVADAVGGQPADLRRTADRRRSLLLRRVALRAAADRRAAPAGRQAAPRHSCRTESSEMTRVIDVHAHILTPEMMADMRREAPSIGPKLAEEGAEHTVLTTGGVPYHPFPRGGWDLERRFADLEAAGIDMQVLAP